MKQYQLTQYYTNTQLKFQNKHQQTREMLLLGTPKALNYVVGMKHPPQSQQIKLQTLQQPCS